MSVNEPPAARRIPELDLLRGLAVLLMVVYHAAYDLSVYWSWDIAVREGWWEVLARVTAILFLGVSGMSVALSFRHATGLRARWRKSVTRFLRIAGAALLVTAATWIADPETYVRFGILHLIAVSALVLPLVAPLKEGNAVVGLIVLFIGQLTSGLQTQSPYLLYFGVTTPDFRTVDYFPIFPWLGVILIGYALGYFVYVRRELTLLPIVSAPRLLTFSGKHALAIYLLHQPILLLILWLLFRLSAPGL